MIFSPKERITGIRVDVVEDSRCEISDTKDC